MVLPRRTTTPHARRLAFRLGRHVATSMETSVAVSAEDCQIFCTFVVDIVVGPMVNLERSCPVADLATMPGTFERC